MHYSNIVQDGELDEKETSIKSNKLFKDQSEFSKESLQNSKKGRKPKIWYN